jgi:hypothetical protein
MPHSDPQNPVLLLWPYYNRWSDQSRDGISERDNLRIRSGPPARHQAGSAGGRAGDQPQDGPDGESCTNWHVTMFFDDNAGTYTIGTPAAGYQASHQACS